MEGQGGGEAQGVADPKKEEEERIHEHGNLRMYVVWGQAFLSIAMAPFA
jgi:hypothetical protein